MGVFRPEMNARRFINSNKRLSMPIIEEDDFVQAVEEIVRVEKDWIPTGEGESLYIRPYMFATEKAIGVHPSHSYKFIMRIIRRVSIRSRFM